MIHSRYWTTPFCRNFFEISTFIFITFIMTGHQLKIQDYALPKKFVLTQYFYWLHNAWSLTLGTGLCPCIKICVNSVFLLISSWLIYDWTLILGTGLWPSIEIYFKLVFLLTSSWLINDWSLTQGSGLWPSKEICVNSVFLLMLQWWRYQGQNVVWW